MVLWWESSTKHDFPCPVRRAHVDSDDIPSRPTMANHSQPKVTGVACTRQPVRSKPLVEMKRRDFSPLANLTSLQTLDLSWSSATPGLGPAVIGIRQFSPLRSLLPTLQRLVL